MKPLFQLSTEKAVQDFLDTPSHALLLSGPAGSGKGTLAQYIAHTLIFGDSIGNLHDHPYTLWYHDLEKGVSIQLIREAQNFMQLKTPGSHAIRRALIVEQGETMSIEAQNAFLKLLEEPPEDTIIIVTTTGLDQLLPTIRSRVQHIRVLAPSLEQLNNYFGELYEPLPIKKAYYTSEGYVGLMKALLDQDNDHPLVAQIAIAKSLLAATTYERLAKVDELTKQKNVSLLLHALERVCHASLMQSVQSSSTSTKRWQQRLKTVVQAESLMRHNPSPKLLLTDLMLDL